MIVQHLCRVLISIMLSMSLSCAFAETTTPTVRLDSVSGYWTTVDDKTGKVRSIMHLWENRGVVYGRIEKIFKQPGDTGICSKCPGQFRNKPILGLAIIWGLEKTGDNIWSGGQILDPHNGKVYRVMLTLANDGKSLKARGYLGISLFGRTQNWYRHY